MKTLIITLALLIGTPTFAEDVIKVKPGQLNVVVFINQTNLANCSFVVRRISPKKEELSKAEREILATDETVFQNLYLKNPATDFFRTKDGFRNERDWNVRAESFKRDGGEIRRSLTLIRPIKFSEPFVFSNSPTNANSLVIEVVDYAALSGKYSFKTLDPDKNNKLVAEKTVEVSSEYDDTVAMMLELSRGSEAALESLKKLKEANQLILEGVTKALEEKTGEIKKKPEEVEKK